MLSVLSFAFLMGSRVILLFLVVLLLVLNVLVLEKRGKCRLSERASELFCPKDFHHYSGVDVCLLFCRKKVCHVFKTLQSK